jgi:hypothetical protein
MAKSSFCIKLNMKIGTEFQNYGKFLLGSDRKLADNIFRKLVGSRKVNDKALLFLEFTETRADLPINVQLISCTLDELTENCKIITKETFKYLDLAQL